MAEFNAGNLVVDVTADISNLVDDIQRAQAEIEAFGEENAEIDLRLDVELLEEAFDSIVTRIVDFDGSEDSIIAIGADLRSFKKQLERAKLQIKKLRGRGGENEILIRAEIEDALIAFQELETKFSEIENEINGTELEVEVKANTEEIEAAAQSVDEDFAAVEESVGKAEETINEAADATSDLSSAASDARSSFASLVKSLAAIAAVTATIGQLGRNIKSLQSDTGLLRDELEAARDPLTRLTDGIPIVGGLVRSLRDAAEAAGIFSDGVTRLRETLAALELQRKTQASLENAEDAARSLEEQLLRVQGASEVKLSEAGFGAVGQIKDQTDAAAENLQDQIEALEKELEKFGAIKVGVEFDEEGNRVAPQFAFPDELDETDKATIRGIAEQITELFRERKELLNLGEEVAAATLIAQQEEAALAAAEEAKRLAEEKARAEEEAARKAKDAEEERIREGKKILDNARALEKLREKSREDAKKAEEDRKQAILDLLTIQGKSPKQLQDRIDQLQKEADSIQQQRDRTRDRLGSTVTGQTAIGQFTFGRDFGSSVSKQTTIQQQISTQIQNITKTLGDILNVLDAQGVSGVLI